MNNFTGNNKLADRFKSLMYNRWILYFIFALSFGNIVYLGSSGDFGNITIFALIGFLTTFFSKNMVVILSIALVFSSIIKYGINLKKNEGFSLTPSDKTKIKSAINKLLGEDEEGFEEDEEGDEGFEGFEEDEEGDEGFEGFEEEEEEGFESFQEGAAPKKPAAPAAPKLQSQKASANDVSSTTTPKATTKFSMADIDKLIAGNPNVRNDPRSMMMINYLRYDQDLAKDPKQLQKMAEWIISSADRAAAITTTPTKGITTTPTFTKISTTSNSSSGIDITTIPGLKNWYDATNPNGDGSIPANGEIIKKWVDKSSNRNHMIGQKQKEGTYVNQNGVQTIKFNKSWYRTATANASYPFDAFIVVKLDSLSNPSDVIGSGGKTSDNFNSLTFGEYPTARGRWHNGSSNFSRTPKAVAGVNETSTGFVLIQWSLANNNYRIYRNGVQIMKTTDYNWSPPKDNEFRLGNRHSNDANNMLQGSVGEVIFFEGQLGDPDRQKVEKYLAQKWGLSIALSTVSAGAALSNVATGAASAAAAISAAAAKATTTPTRTATTTPTRMAINTNPFNLASGKIAFDKAIADAAAKATTTPTRMTTNYAPTNTFGKAIAAAAIATTTPTRMTTNYAPTNTFGKAIAAAAIATTTPTRMTTTYAPILAKTSPTTLIAATYTPTITAAKLAATTATTPVTIDVKPILDDYPNITLYKDLSDKLIDTVKEARAESVKKEGFRGEEKVSQRIKNKIQSIINEANSRVAAENSNQAVQNVAAGVQNVASRVRGGGGVSVTGTPTTTPQAAAVQQATTTPQAAGRGSRNAVPVTETPTTTPQAVVVQQAAAAVPQAAGRGSKNVVSVTETPTTTPQAAVQQVAATVPQSGGRVRGGGGVPVTETPTTTPQAVVVQQAAAAVPQAAGRGSKNVVSVTETPTTTPQSFFQSFQSLFQQVPTTTTPIAPIAPIIIGRRR